ncbi:kelch repeat protein-like protein [Lojkania enalia]|uniref:Kelch repeat protein-like protein n=1 Tax=Lojkania enalia TaxID=147567 RepID=A0A9P4N9M8_9PLEO|nr:kelch repeat protein-like protein [Didymosphaeria enalia]
MEPGRRKSVFLEVGLVDESIIRRERSPTPILVSDPPKRIRPARIVRFRTREDIWEQEADYESSEWESTSDSDEMEDNTSAAVALPPSQHFNLYSKLYRIGLLALVLALALPVFQMDSISPVGVKGGAIPTHSIESSKRSPLRKREDTNTNICKRWSHQTAIVNGTLYMYGGRSTTDATQDSDTWNNDFLTLDLTKSWQISDPSLTGLPRPSGPPEVANGYLWNSLSSLFLYGGEFSDTPKAAPVAFSLWEYNIGSQQWIEHQNPTTSAGVNAEGDGQPVQRSAEGAGFGVSTLGRGWYFGGHLDDFTTEGWSNQIKRIYLKSLIEFTFPGATNNAVESLGDGQTAGQDGVWRNITEGGLQDTAGFTERADGLLLYIPGFGEEGILLGLAGGVNESFTQMNVIDVYDIARSTWYKQTTSGEMPKYRVNPCAVVAAAADGSSYNVYMFGGQNLQPTGEQIQYDDMWILSVPSFTWIEVDQSKQSIPYARAGHTCNVWDGQMIIVGGYVGQELSCDSPGIYVFNMSSLQWSDQFTALTGERATKGWSGEEDDNGNPLAQQVNQRGFDSKAGLEGSYGYAVPPAVQSVIGGKETGGATLTAPMQTPTEGPFATGKPQTYTVTGPNGGIITETAASGSNTSSGASGTNVGAIVAGVIAGVFAVVAAYFAFCAWVYRKQVRIWKQHAAMVSARNAQAEKNDPFAAQGATIASSGKNSSERNPLSNVNTHPGSAHSSHAGSGIGYAGAAGVAAGEEGRRSSVSSTDDLLEGQEPSFWGMQGVLLNPRRSLRVINRD